MNSFYKITLLQTAAALFLVSTLQGIRPLEEHIRRTAGGTATLFCSVSNGSWTKDGRPYSANNNSLIEISNSNGYTKLKISKLKYDDQGIYICFNMKFNVEVYELRTLKAQKRKVTAVWKESVKMACVFTNKDRYRGALFVRWFFLAENSKQFERIPPSNRHKTHWSEEKTKSTLILLSTRPSDAGRYKCVGGPLESLAEAKATIQLTVVGTKPQIREPLPRILERYEGTNIRLICGVDGLPRPTYSWQKKLENGTVILIGSERELQLHYVTAIDAGRYECVGTNQNGNVTDGCTLLLKGADDKQVELITPNSQSQAIVSFEIKYPYFQLEKADVAVFVVVNGDTKHSLFPINFVSHCAFFIKIDSLSFNHDGFYRSIIRDKRTGYVLQDSIKQLDVKGPPEALSNDQVHYHYSNSSLIIIVMATKSTNQPVKSVGVKLWEYTLKNLTSLVAVAEATTTLIGGNATFSLKVQNPNATMALEVIAFGTFGSSKPLLKSVTLKITNTTGGELEFPQTHLVSVFNREALTASCFDEVFIYQDTPDFLANLRTDKVYVYNFVIQSYMIKPAIDALKNNGVSIDEQSTFVIAEGFSLQIDFTGKTLAEAMQNFQNFQSTIDGLGSVKVGSCQMKLQYCCIAKYRKNYENAPTEQSPTQTEAYTTSGETSMPVQTSALTFSITLVLMYDNF